MRIARWLIVGFGAAFAALCLTYVLAVAITGSLRIDAPALAQVRDAPPNAAVALPDRADNRAGMWRGIRDGARGYVSIPDKKAGVLIQSEGENWRAFRNGPLSVFGIWAMAGMIALLALFFAIRGRIRIRSGRSDMVVQRFNIVERFAHWVTAVSFVILALTGLNILYGRYALLPVIGPGAFSDVTQFGKLLHNYVAFAFMVGLVLIFVLWVGQNLPSRVDLNWLAKGGGMFSRGTHVHARKFNAGQKILFWAVILGGLSVSLSGISLLWPFELPLFGKTFAALNWIGFDLPSDLRPMQEMQLSQLWHAAVGLIMIAIIIAHIYIGTVGMEGAFDAMGNGMVDRNWAREHHDLWAEKLAPEPKQGGDD